MTVRVYSNQDAGAPTLTGQAGSLTNLLDKVLVEGYGTVAPAGWEIVFTGTDKRAYRAIDVGGTRHFMQVIDDGSTPTNGARTGLIRGYESMSDVENGTAAFPTVEQQANGLYINKSSTLDGAARPWMAFSDLHTLWIWTAWLASTPTRGSIHGFGDLLSFSGAADAHRAFIFGSEVLTSTSLNSYSGAMNLAAHAAISRVSVIGQYLARSVDGVTMSPPAAWISAGGGAAPGEAGLEQPSAVSSSYDLSPIAMYVPNSELRGVMPGLYNIVGKTGGLTSPEAFGSSLSLQGRAVQLLPIKALNSAIAIDTTGPWQ